MKKKGKASVSHVGQNSLLAARERPRRDVKISLRITQKMAGKKSQELSWSEYLERLQNASAGKDLTAPERTRKAAWAAVSLDRLVHELSRFLPADASEPVGAKLNRLELLARFTEEAATIRAHLEEIYHAG